MPTSWQEGLELYDWTLFYADPASFVCLGIVFSRKNSTDKEGFLDQHRERMLLLQLPIARQRTKNFLLRAEDLLEFGIKPSKYLGELLKEAERIAVNKQLNDKKSVLEHLQKSSIWQSTKNNGAQ